MRKTNSPFTHGRPSFNSANPNSAWLYTKGFIIWYLFILVAIHVSLLVLPFDLGHWKWTATSGVHAVLTFMLFHWIKGTPFPTIDSENQTQTQWEQLDDEEDGYAYNRKMVNLIPVVLFILCVHKTSHDPTHFLINFIFAGICLVPKMVRLQNIRILNFNKY